MGFLTLFLIGVIIILVITLSKVSKNSQKIEELNRQFFNMKKFMESAGKTSTVKTPSAKKEKPEKAKAAPAVKSEILEDISFDDLSESTPDKPARKVAAEKKSMTRNEWEILIGGKVLNRIGAFAIIIGISFFLKYAFDNDWISESVRVIIGAVIGFIFIGGALKSYRKDYKIFSQGLSGTGISILYLSVYASFNYYYLVSQPVAFMLMSAVTVLTFVQAFYYNSMAVSLIGLFGGFLTPFLLSTGHPNEVGLFSYLALLNVGLIIVAMRKSSWMVLEILAVAATYIIYYSWYAEYFEKDKSAVALIFLTIFWGIFFAANIIHIFKSNRLNLELRLTTAVFNLFLYSFAIFFIIDYHYDDWTGAAAAGLSGIYFLYYYFIQKHRSVFDKELNFSLLSGIILFSLFIYFHFTGYLIIIFWSINILLLIRFGVKYKVNLLLSAGLVLTFVTLLKFLETDGALTYEVFKDYNFLFSLRTLSYLVLSLVFALSAYLLRNRELKNSRSFGSFYLYLACAAIFVFLTVETNDYFRTLHFNKDYPELGLVIFRELLTLSGIWIYYSLILVFIGYRKNIIELIVSSIFSLGLGIIFAVFTGITYRPIEEFALVLNFRAALLALILLGSSAHLFYLRMYPDLFDWLKTFYKILQVAMVILLLTLVTGEIKDYFNREIILLNSRSAGYTGMLSTLENLQQMLLSAGWLVVSSFLIAAGIWKKVRIIRITAIVIFGIAILKMFLYDLSFLDTVYRIISFIGLGLILLAASFLYQKYKKFIFN
ncbi:DUF2339 domain-containing protein [Bacteroidota bacterium]